MKPLTPDNEALVHYRDHADVWLNGEILATRMNYERQARGVRGFCLDYGRGEMVHHRRYSAAFERDAGFLMAVARDQRRPVKLFKNANGQMAASLA